MAVLLKNPVTGKFLTYTASDGTVKVLCRDLTLSEPEVWLDQSDPNELIVEVTNNNDVDVTFYVTAYDTHDMAFGSTYFQVKAHSTVGSYILLSSSVTEGYIEAFFTAHGYQGYEDSDVVVVEW